MSCPTCGKRQWTYSGHTLTCKSGHLTDPDGTPLDGKRPSRRVPSWAIPATAFGTLALDFLVRTIT